MIRRMILNWLLPPKENVPLAVKNNELKLLHELNRLKMAEKFKTLSERASEIEEEWRRIQQDEHDALEAFQTTLKEDNKQDYYYKKGITEGIKWCINRFS